MTPELSEQIAASFRMLLARRTFHPRRLGVSFHKEPGEVHHAYGYFPRMDIGPQNVEAFEQLPGGNYSPEWPRMYAIRFDTSSVAVAQMFRDIAAEFEKKEEPR